MNSRPDTKPLSKLVYSWLVLSGCADGVRAADREARVRRPALQPFHHPADEDLSSGTPGREAGATKGSGVPRAGGFSGRCIWVVGLRVEFCQGESRAEVLLAWVDGRH